MNPYENIDWMLNDSQHDGKPLVSSCCSSANMIEPDWEMADEAGSLWRAYACYICRECGKACDTVEVDKQ
jgi:hypothetical protein